MTEPALTNEHILTTFTHTAQHLHALTHQLSDAQLDLAIEAGGWTVRQLIHHLADDCDVWSMAIKKAIATPGARILFADFPGNEPWADALHFEQREAASALVLIQAHRHYLAGLLRHFSDAWERCVRLVNAAGEIRREITVREMVIMLSEHMQEHVAALEATLRANQ